MSSIMISAGEASGDLHGSNLVHELKKLDSQAQIFGIGGDKMQAAGMKLLYHINSMSIVGLTEIIRHIPFLRKVFRHLKNELRKRKPQLLILIDYPGFNLRLAKLANSMGITIVYYITPQVWAWGHHRIKKMARLVNQAIVILPFEKNIFIDAGIKTEFVGHPLLDFLKVKLNKQSFFQNLGLSSTKKTIGLLPGSRVSEVKNLLPNMLATVYALRQKNSDIQILISKAPALDESLFKNVFQSNSEIKLVDNQTYEIMKYSDLLMVASGTATLEASFFKTPMVIVYKVSRITYLIGKILIKIKDIGLVNIIAGSRIVPEFVQNDFTVNKMLPVMESLLFDKEKIEIIRANLSEIKHKMGTPGAAKRAARIAMNLIR